MPRKSWGLKTDEAKLLRLPWDSVEETLTFSGDSH